MRINKWIIRLGTEISENNPDFGVLTPDKSHATMVHFQKNMLEQDQYVMKLYPTNALSDDPSEKIEQVERMVDGGWIDPQTARRLMDFPDLETFEDLDMAAFNAVEMCISAALKDGVYIGPERFLPLGNPQAPGPAIRQVQNALIRAFARKAPESRMRLLKQWLSDALSLMPQQTVVGAATQFPGMVGAAPSAAPVPQLSGAPTGGGEGAPPGQ